MRSIKLIFIMTLVTTSAKAADVVYAKTKFWQAPYETSIQVELDKNDKDLVAECKSFQNVVFDQSGKVRIWAKHQMETLRSLPLPTESKQDFYAEFLTSIPLSQNILTSQVLDRLTSAIHQSRVDDLLPEYAQLPAEVLLNTSNTSEFISNHSPNSLTQVSASFGLPRLPIYFQKRTEGVFLIVSGKDTACDLINKQIMLSVNVPAVVKISLENQMNLSKFYAGVEKAFAQSAQHFHSNRARAASFGVRIGALLDEKNISGDEQDRLIGNLMDILFIDDAMSLSSYWLSNGSANFLTVDGASGPVPVQIQIR